MTTFPDFNSFRARAGQSLGYSEWVSVTQEMVNQFAEATKDFQWIHIDVDRANRESPFGKPIAHGFLSLSLLSHLIESMVMIDSAKMGVNYGLNKVRFPNHVAVGARLRLQLGIGKVEEAANNGIKIYWDCVVEIEGKQKPACVAEFITMLFE